MQPIKNLSDLFPNMVYSSWLKQTVLLRFFLIITLNTYKLDGIIVAEQNRFVGCFLLFHCWLFCWQLKRLVNGRDLCLWFQFFVSFLIPTSSNCCLLEHSSFGFVPFVNIASILYWNCSCSTVHGTSILRLSIMRPGSIIFYDIVFILSLNLPPF